MKISDLALAPAVDLVRLERLEAENTKLRAENDAIKRTWGQFEQLQTQLGEALAREQTLRAALEPFARNVNAVSLSAALGHIEREHLWNARAVLEETR